MFLFELAADCSMPVVNLVAMMYRHCDGALSHFCTSAANSCKHTQLYSHAIVPRCIFMQAYPAAYPCKHMVATIDLSLDHTGSADHTVRVWGPKTQEGLEQSVKETSTMTLLKTLPTKATPVFHVSFTSKNLLLASGALTLRR